MNGLILGLGKNFKVKCRTRVTLLSGIKSATGEGNFFIVWKKPKWKTSNHRGVAYILIEGCCKPIPSKRVRDYSAHHLDLHYYRIIQRGKKVKSWFLEELEEIKEEVVSKEEDD